MQNQQKNKEIKKIIESIKKELNFKINKEVIQEVIKKIEKKSKEKKILCEVFIGGSFAKETFLSDDFDCDIFLRFDMRYDNNMLSDLAEELIKDFNPLRIHGSRDYFNFEYKGINFEVVPVYKIDDPKEAINTTDISPFHVLWFNKKRKKNKELNQEVRVTKLFLKAQKLYGAESYIKGFSGHVVDILVAFYGNFLELVKTTQEWKFPIIIDIENHYKNKNPLFFLNRDKIKNEFIVIDPIIKERNAAAAVSKENVIKFIKVCKKFLENPSKDFFVIKYLNVKSAKEIINSYPGVIFEVQPLENKSKDVAGTKAFKAFEFLKKNLERYGFKVLGSDFDWDKKNDIIFFLKFDKHKLENVKIILGPPNKERFKKHIDVFRKKYKKKTFIENGRWYAKIEREYTSPFEYLEKLVKDKRFIKNIRHYKIYKINEKSLE